MSVRDIIGKSSKKTTVVSKTPSSKSSPTASSSSAKSYESSGERCYEIESIPDFLQDHRLLSDDLSGRLQEHCRKWTTVVDGLALTDKEDANWQLRYRYVPKDGKVYVALLGRMNPGTSASFEAARSSFEGFGVHLKDPTSERLSWWTSPLWKHAYAVEPQEELVATQKVINNDEDFTYRTKTHYQIVPWWGPGGTFAQVFNALARCEHEVELGISLARAELTEEQKSFLEWFCFKMKTEADKQQGLDEGHTITDVQREPNADWLCKTYSANLRRLNHAFQCAVTVCSNDPTSVLTVAQTLKSIISEEIPFETTQGNEDRFHSQAEVHALEGTKKDAYLRSYQSISVPTVESEKLEAALEKIDPEGYLSGTERRSSKDRLKKVLENLRYLMDARGASTVFRFPVSVNSGVAGLEVQQRAPDFIPGNRRVNNNPTDKEVLIGSFESGGWAILPVNSFRQHALVTGFTGSGKTQTVFGLLHQFWNRCNIPFLAIESAKKEYRGLINVKGWRDDKPTRVYTLGNSVGVPFRLNPFEVQEGVRIELHINRIASCFEAAFPQLPFLTSIMTEALQNVYDRLGWTLTSFGPTRAKAGARQPVFPTLDDFVKEVEKITAERGYAGENAANVNAAIQGRLKNLLLGSVGDMLNCERSTPLDELFSCATILELNDLNEQDKSLVTMFLLVFLREYRELHPSDDLTHVTVVEEAHNILEKTGHADAEMSSDSKAKVVASFCNMLTELRAYGEGLIIADQSPNKLATDAIRNTNVQIAHQLRDSDDRDAVARAMIMTDEQRDFIGKLRPGRAALFYTGLERATFVAVPPYSEGGDKGDKLPGEGFAPLSDVELRKKMGVTIPNAHYRECKGCPCPVCLHKEVAALVLDEGKRDEDTAKAKVQKDIRILRSGDSTEDERLAHREYLGIRAYMLAKKRWGSDVSPERIFCTMLHFFHIDAGGSMPLGFVDALRAESKRAKRNFDGIDG